jgi:hypothetical protein
VLVQVLFGISILFSFVAWGVVTRQYVWPALRSRSLSDALRPILTLHSFRFVGLSFLVPGVASAAIPAAFAQPAAYGDLATAVLALLALATLGKPIGKVLVWTFNVVGTVDLLHAFFVAGSLRLDPGMQGAAFFIPTILVPLLLTTHFLVFRLLVRSENRLGS